VRIIHTADLHLGTTTYGNEDPSTGINRRVHDFFATSASLSIHSTIVRSEVTSIRLGSCLYAKMS